MPSLPDTASHSDPPERRPPRPEVDVNSLPCLGPEQVESMLYLLRGLVKCLGDLDQRITDLERHHPG